MQAGVGAIDSVDVAALVHLDIVGLDRDLAALLGTLADAALLCVLRYRGNVIRDLLRMKWIAHVHRAHPGVEMREKEDAPVVHRREALARGMRAEAPAAAAEAAAPLRHRPGGDAHRPCLVGDVDENRHLARLLALVAEGRRGEDDEIVLA